MPCAHDLPSFPPIAISAAESFCFLTALRVMPPLGIVCCFAPALRNCMHMYKYVHIHLSLKICVYVHVYLYRVLYCSDFVHLIQFIYMYTYTLLYMYSNMHIHCLLHYVLNLHWYIYTCICIYIYTCIYIYIYTHIAIYTIYVYTNMYIQKIYEQYVYIITFTYCLRTCPSFAHLHIDTYMNMYTYAHVSRYICMAHICISV